MKHRIDRIQVVCLLISTMATSIVTAQGYFPTTPLSDAQLLTLELSPVVPAVEWSPDGTLLAVSQGDVVSIWEVDTGEEFRTFQGDTFYVVSLAWHPSGEQLAASGNRVVVWDVKTGQNLNFLDFPANEANSGIVDWSPDGEKLAFTHWNYNPENPYGSITQIWTETTDEVSNLGHRLTTGLTSARWSPDGSMLAITDNDTINIWDVESGELLIEFDAVSDVSDLAWSPDSTMLAAGNSKGVDLSRGNTEGYNYSRVIQIWDIQTGDVLLEMDGHTGSVLSIDWSPDGTMLASAGADATVRIWDVRSSQMVVLIREHTDSVNSVVWSPDGTMLASGSSDGTAIVWDVQMLLRAKH